VWRGQQPLRDALALGHQREGGLPDAARAPGGTDIEEGGLRSGGQAPCGGGVLEPLSLGGVPGERVAREDGGVEDGLREADPGFPLEWDGDVDVGGEPVGADHLVERGVGRVHEVAQVEGAAQLAVAGVHRKAREEATPRLAQACLRLRDGLALLAQADVAAERLGDDGVERAHRALGGQSAARRREEQRREHDPFRP